VLALGLRNSDNVSPTAKTQLEKEHQKTSQSIKTVEK
jgi:hypothetical protein